MKHRVRECSQITYDCGNGGQIDSNCRSHKKFTKIVQLSLEDIEKNTVKLYDMSRVGKSMTVCNPT